MIGKDVRLRKIINAATGRTCIVPLDHAVTVGPIKGLNHMVNTIHEIGVEKTNAFIVHKGVFSHLVNYPSLLEKGQFIMHLSASTNLGDLPLNKCIISSVEQAIRLGAIGVSLHVNLGNCYESQMLKDLGTIADRCSLWGMPLIAMMYVRNDGDTYSSDTLRIAHAARVAQELGADLVKIACPKEVYEIRDIVDSVQIPVLISGGEKMNDLQFLEQVEEALEAGAAGVSVGRNIFQSDNPKRLITYVSDLVHKEMSMKDIRQKFIFEKEFILR